MSKVEDRARELFRQYRREIAEKGGHARAKKMTAEQRSTAARKAARARWKKVKAA